MASYTYLTIMEVRTRLETVGARIQRFMSCVGQEKKVVGVLAGVVVGVIIITLVVSMVTMRNKADSGEDLESGYMKGNQAFDDTHPTFLHQITCSTSWRRKVRYSWSWIVMMKVWLSSS